MAIRSLLARSKLPSLVRISVGIIVAVAGATAGREAHAGDWEVLIVAVPLTHPVLGFEQRYWPPDPMMQVVAWPTASGAWIGRTLRVMARAASTRGRTRRIVPCLRTCRICLDSSFRFLSRGAGAGMAGAVPRQSAEHPARRGS